MKSHSYIIVCISTVDPLKLRLDLKISLAGVVIKEEEEEDDRKFGPCSLFFRWLLSDAGSL